MCNSSNAGYASSFYKKITENTGLVITPGLLSWTKMSDYIHLRDRMIVTTTKVRDDGGSDTSNPANKK